jgi:predicted GH43/DUF377 family glycosyl hydrolase
MRLGFKWKKLGNVFNPANINTPDWMNEFAQAPHVVHHQTFIRVYFSCRPKADENGQYVSYSAFVDFDKNDLSKIIKISQKPILKLGELGTFDEFGTYPVSVIKKENEYLAYYAGWTRCESVPFNTSIGFAKSNDDGETFEKIGHGPILPYTLNEPFILSGPKIRFFNNKYFLFYIAGTEWILDEGKPEPIYKIKMAISHDGLNWVKNNFELIQSKIENEAQASPDVFYKDGMYHMFFCYRGGKNYRGKANGYRIGYASSSDLINWERNDEIVGIDVSDEGWDSEMISYPHVFELNEDIYMYYLGNSVGKNGFGLAVLEK